jgi:conjugal transfer pilus assembly protein TraE
MHYSITAQKLEQTHKQRRLFVGLLALSLLVNCVQGLERLFLSEKIIILPPDIQKEVWVRGTQVSASYLEEWSYYVCSLLLTRSPHTIEYQTDLVLRHVSPEAYGALKQQLKQEAVVLKKNNAATVFQPKEIIVDAQNMTARVTGSLSSLVGKDRVLEKQHTYQLAFAMTQSKFLQLTRFERIKSLKEQEEGHDLTHF